MSYPSPYQPPTPQYGFDYYQPDALAPARRAGNLMIVIGALTVFSSVCCGGVGAMLPRMINENPAMFEELERLPNMTPHLMQVVLLVTGGLFFLVGVSYFVLGLFVRRGGKGAMITSMVLSVVIILLLLVQIVGVVVQGRSISLGQLGTTMCMLVLPIALLALLLMWLLSAMRGADRATAARYAMQYWQYAQQQQAYGQPYGYPPPPAQAGGPAQPPPPPPPNDLTPPSA